MKKIFLCLFILFLFSLTTIAQTDPFKKIPDTTFSFIVFLRGNTGKGYTNFLCYFEDAIKSGEIIIRN